MKSPTAFTAFRRAFRRWRRAASRSNQFLIDADEPLLFHTGLRHMFPLVSQAVARIVPLERLRWIAFGHVEPTSAAR
jgi:flavorubredoxin